MGNEALLESHDMLSIIVIDDEERIRNGCQKVLSQEGFDVATADCGELGMRMIEERHFDIILLDLMMPSLSGFDVLAHVKSLHPDSLIIVISGYATVEHSIEAMKRGAFDFIPKPFTAEQLRLLVTKAIEYTRALQDIAGEKTRMRVLINHLRDGVMAVDTRKHVVLANPAFLRTLGFKGERPVGLQARDVCQGSSIESLIDRALAIHNGDTAEIKEELTLEGRDGQPNCVLDTRCIPFRNRIGRNVGAIVVVHDITASKRMEQIKSDFVSMVSHEVRSPLSSVLAQLKVVLDGLAGEVTARQREILGRAYEKTEGLICLSSELLDLARIESGMMEQEMDELNVLEILEDQVAFHLAGAHAKGLDLRLESLPVLPPIVGNRRNLEEVLSNLIGNAVKYTPEGGTILVSAGPEDGYLRLSVRDSGVGIPADELGRIFSPFYRVKNERTRFIIGTGLGLAIVKNIVEAHRGLIRVESEVDRGSVFHVHIPLKEDRSPSSCHSCAA